MNRDKWKGERIPSTSAWHPSSAPKSLGYQMCWGECTRQRRREKRQGVCLCQLERNQGDNVLIQSFNSSSIKSNKKEHQPSSECGANPTCRGLSCERWGRLAGGQNLRNLVDEDDESVLASLGYQRLGEATNDLGSLTYPCQSSAEADSSWNVYGGCIEEHRGRR